MTRWFKKIASAGLLLFVISCIPSSIPTPQPPNDTDLNLATSVRTVEVKTALGEVLQVPDAPHLTETERRSRNAAVKVRSLTQGGHGSGSYMVAYGRHVVVTAAHVVRNETVMAIDGRDGETVVGQVVFVDTTNDIAFVVVPKIKSRRPVKYKPYRSYDERLIGVPVTYTGFPSHHDLLTIRGYVSSLEHNMVVANAFGWFGSSGSGVYDPRGRLVGVVSGIDIGNIGFRIPLDAIVWIAPISQIDEDTLEVRIRTASKLDKINSFPGAAAPRRGEASP